MLSDRKTRRRVVSGVIGAIALILFIAACIPMLPGKKGKGDIQAGVDYITSLAKKDPADVEAQIKQIKKQELKAALAEDMGSVWSYFDDVIIMGDSRCMGFYIFDFLTEDRVMAHSGATIHDIPDYIDELKLKNPGIIFLCYGLNDMGIGYYNTVEDYLTELESMLDLLHTSLPDTEVYVSSIIAAKPNPKMTEDLRSKPDRFNPAIKAYCEENGVGYVDCTQLREENLDLFDIDGMHFTPAFYEPWAVTLISEIGGE